MSTFKDRAQIGLDRGIPVIRLAPRAKTPYRGEGVSFATTDPAIVARWAEENPDCNCGFVAKIEPGGVWILETDSNKLAKKYEEETGRKFTTTFTVQSRKGGHRYYLHNVASSEMGNIGQDEADGFSVRAHNQYCVSPLSVHPTGAVYMTRLDGPIVEAEPEMIEWLVAQKKSKAPTTALTPGQKISHGAIHDYMLDNAIRLRKMGLPESMIEQNLMYLVHENCVSPIDDKKISQMAKSMSSV